MAQVSFKLRIDPGAVRDSAKRAAGPIIKREMERAGQEMVDEANRLMASRFDLNRPYNRRRYPGSRRAANALDFEISGDADRFIVGYRVLGGTEVFKRILGMNYPIPAHDIRPSGNWPLKGAHLAVRSNPTRQQAAAGSGANGWLYFPVPEGGKYRRARKVYWKPKVDRTGFLEEARDKAVRSIGGRRIA